MKERLFRSAYTKDRYTPPLVLMKETDSIPIVFWDKGFIAYRDKIVGIHAPRSQIYDLHRFYEFLIKNHALYRFACTLNGTQFLVGKATAILKRDIDILPYPKAAEEISLSFWEKAMCEDVLEYITAYVRYRQDSDLLQTAAEGQILRNYSSLFVRMLGSVYDNLKVSTPGFLSGLICQPFYFGERPNLEWLAEYPETGLRKLIYNENHDHLRTVRLLRIYSGNVLLLIKPDRLRYWIRSTAIRDADETLLDLRQQGY